MKRSSPPTCVAPFDRGIKLCSVCSLTPASPGLRHCSRLVVESKAMRALMIKAAPIALTDASVIILGESGTGKEVLARALHANSPRKDRPFLAVNVAALPPDLLESELFGHVRGAFTGAAADKEGLFAAADGGTLLLDEIAEMPLPLQAKLLRVLADGEVRRVGDVRPFAVDVRIFCATHQDLRACIQQHRFREDLYYRLKVFTLAVPALRDRQADILPLARMFLEQRRRSSPARFTPAAERALESYDWPGNVRELASAVEHGAALAQGQDVDAHHLPDEIAAPSTVHLLSPRDRTLAEVERTHILSIMESCDGRQADASRILGIGRTTLWRKLRAYGITRTR